MLGTRETNKREEKKKEISHGLLRVIDHGCGLLIPGLHEVGTRLDLFLVLGQHAAVAATCREAIAKT